MKSNYRLIARNLMKHRAFTGINLVGLAVGIAAAALIFQVLKFHLRTDRHFAKADRTYRVVLDLHLEDGSLSHQRGSAFVLHETLKKDYSYVEDAAYVAHKELTTRVDQDGEVQRYQEKDHVVFTNSDYFKIFDHTWLNGTAKAMQAPNQVVLTERYARKYFGDRDPIGRVIRVNNQENLVVAGIVADYEDNTDFQYDMFVSLPTLRKIEPDYGYEEWGMIDSNRETFVTLRSTSFWQPFERQMPALATKYYGPDARIFHYHLQALSDVHFNADYGGKIRYSTLAVLAVVGLLIVLIACFNFVNLSLAQALRRGREIGVRKALGGSKMQVMVLFMKETAVLVGISAMLSLLLAWAFAPVLSGWLHVRVRVNVLNDPWLLLFYVLLAVVVVLLAGAYPAVSIAQMHPVKALKGMVKQNNRAAFSVRKVLIVTQFCISFVLIAVSILIIGQSEYLRNKDLGLDKDLILHVNLPETDAAKLSTLRSELSSIPEVADLSFCKGAPSSQLRGGGSVMLEGREWEKFLVHSKPADSHFATTYGLKLTAGRLPVPSDTLRELLINQKLLRALGLKMPADALDKRLTLGDGQRTGIIVGVVRDFNNSDLYSEIEPTVIYADRTRYRWAGIKLRTVNALTIHRVETVWQRQFPEHVLEYHFYDEELARFYEREQLTARLITGFALVSVFLSALGLLGLAMFAIAQRKREISIRKVVGASVTGIAAMLSLDFVKLVLAAVVAGSPIAWYLMNRWLQDFPYHMAISWWIFALAGVIATGIAVLTVSFQSIKAALTDPVKNLKSE